MHWNAESRRLINSMRTAEPHNCAAITLDINQFMVGVRNYYNKYIPSPSILQGKAFNFYTFEM